MLLTFKLYMRIFNLKGIQYSNTIIMSPKMYQNRFLFSFKIIFV